MFNDRRQYRSSSSTFEINSAVFGLEQLDRPNNQQRSLTYGVQMTIVPHVSSNNIIQMDIKNAAVSDLIHDRKLPRLVGHTLSSSVYVSNGNALIIGGLLQKKKQSQVHGIEGASDLPIVGGLFKQTTKNTYETEVLIMIRPRLING